MFSLFQSSLPSRYIFLVIVWLILTVLAFVFPHSMEINHFRIMLDAQKINEGLYLYHSIYDYAGVIPVYINAFLITFFSIDSFAIKILASLLILINAIYFNAIVDKYQLIRERSFAPGLLVLLFSYSFYQNLELSTILLGNFFITLSVSSLLKTGQESQDVTGNVFKAGIYLGLAFLCDQSFIIFLILGLVALQYYTSRGSSYINLILGWTFPAMILLIIYLFFGFHRDFLDYFFVRYFTYTTIESSISMLYYLPWIVASVLILMFFFMKKSTMSFKNYISKAHQIIIFWMILSIFTFFIMKDRQLSSVYLLVNPLGFMASFFMINIRRNWIKETVFMLLVLFSIGFNFLIEKNEIVNQNVIEASKIKKTTQRYDGKVLSLTEDLSIYTTNEHGSSFTNWNLEKSTFLNLIELGNLEKIYVGIIADYPKYIIDPNGIFDRIFERAPLFRKKYKKVDSKTYRLVNMD